MKEPQIIAMGGGTFGSGKANLLLERYGLEQTGTTHPRVCFIPTATGDSATYIELFYAVFKRINSQPTHLPLFTRTPLDLRSLLLGQDLIFVGGGNTKSMLGVWREWGLEEILREAWSSGVVLAGVSAGANCWFDWNVTDSWEGELRGIPGLGFLEGSFCPHYDGEADRQPSFHHLVRTGTIPGGLAADDGVAFHFKGRELYRTVSSLPSARGYRVESDKDGVRQTGITPLFLGDSSH